MRHLEAQVYTVKDLRDWLNNIDENMTVWVSPEWGDTAKPLRHIYIEKDMMINYYGSKEPSLILDATPEKEIPNDGTGKLARY